MVISLRYTAAVLQMLLISYNPAMNQSEYNFPVDIVPGNNAWGPASSTNPALFMRTLDGSMKLTAAIGILHKAREMQNQ